MLRQSLIGELKATSATKARKQFQRSVPSQHSRCHRSAEETPHDIWGLLLCAGIQLGWRRVMPEPGHTNDPV